MHSKVSPLKLLLVFSLAFVTTAVFIDEAQAKRFGGGRTFGIKRALPVKPPTSAPRQGSTTGSAANTTRQPNRWLGPVAGLAAGLGLAALFSHLGLSEGFATIFMLLLLALGAFLLLRWFVIRSMKTANQQFAAHGKAHAASDIWNATIREGSSTHNGHFQGQSFNTEAATQAEVVQGATDLLPGFNVEAFVRTAKVNFLRLQVAHDAGNLADLREFTTPEVYAEIKLDIDERQGVTQHTEISNLQAELVDLFIDGSQQIVASVAFSGLANETPGTMPQPFHEVWHLNKPVNGEHGWLVAGIQQAD